MRQLEHVSPVLSGEQLALDQMCIASGAVCNIHRVHLPVGDNVFFVTCRHRKVGSDFSVS